MKTILAALLLAGISLTAKADTITFTGIVTTKTVFGDYFTDNPGFQAADIGSPINGFMTFDPYVTALSIVFPNAFIDSPRSVTFSRSSTEFSFYGDPGASYPRL